MSDDGIGPYTSPEPSPFRLEESWSNGYGESYEPDQMVKTLEGMQKKLRVDSDRYQELERIITFIKHHDESTLPRDYKQLQEAHDRLIAEYTRFRQQHSWCGSEDRMGK